MKSTCVLAQMASVLEPEENLKKVKSMTQEASETYHPDVIVFPEYCMSTAKPGTVSPMESLEGPFVTELRKLAKVYGVWIIFGINEQPEDTSDPRYYNTTVILNGAGEIVSTYRKTHLYDAFHYRESDQMLPGDKLFEPIDTPFGKLGLMVCYEVRFPEVARYQKEHGAEILVMPTAWAAGKLKSLHYNTLIHARAIENTLFVLACDQCHAGAIGESVAVDPMGVTIAAAGGQETLLVARVDTDQIKEVGKVLPSYENRRTDLYP